MKIDSKTQLACLIGHPVSHSFSPYIHNFLAQEYGVNLRYVSLDVSPDRVKEAVEGIRALGIVGSNVTIPHKIEVMEHLDEIEKNAKIIGAVNTIKNDHGKLIGYNTDALGFVNSVLNEGHSLLGKHVMVLGAGGASRAIVVELAAHGVSKITICNNTIQKAEVIAQKVRSHFEKVEVVVRTLDVNEEDLEGVDFLINTTPLGMSSQKDLSPIDEKIMPPKNLVVCDIVYTPHDTKLLKWAQSYDLKVVRGIGMLINQAISSFEIWTGLKVNAYEKVYQLLKQEGIIIE